MDSPSRGLLPSCSIRAATDDPVALSANTSKSFQGSIVLGMGFTFDDTDRKGVASSLAEMRRLIAAEPQEREKSSFRTSAARK